MDLSKFLMDDETSEWKIKRLIRQEVSKPSGNHMETSSRIFGYATALLAVLKLRYEHFFSSESYDRYWEWIKQIEKTSPGPVKIIDSLKDNGDLDEFIREFAHHWVIQQHNKAVYTKMDSSRMPRLFSQNFTGQIDFQHSDYVDDWSTSLSPLKFKRMADILYELDLVEGDDFDHLRITERGKILINRFCEVLS